MQMHELIVDVDALPCVRWRAGLFFVSASFSLSLFPSRLLAGPSHANPADLFSLQLEPLLSFHPPFPFLEGSWSLRRVDRRIPHEIPLFLLILSID